MKISILLQVAHNRSDHTAAGTCHIKHHLTTAKDTTVPITSRAKIDMAQTKTDTVQTKTDTAQTKTDTVQTRVIDRTKGATIETILRIRVKDILIINTAVARGIIKDRGLINMAKTRGVTTQGLILAQIDIKVTQHGVELKKYE
ncbi:unnamed protein product [Euphydryas editha]|uniref:Antifreeze protein n=1 Tax=Euphydryas editha TaxID=104508 RepID=A0AAU9U5T6_EUPED|nr:unnamed protein product [Euphydryas editha]